MDTRAKTFKRINREQREFSNTIHSVKEHRTVDVFNSYLVWMCFNESPGSTTNMVTEIFLHFLATSGTGSRRQRITWVFIVTALSNNLAKLDIFRGSVTIVIWVTLFLFHSSISLFYVTLWRCWTQHTLALSPPYWHGFGVRATQDYKALPAIPARPPGPVHHQLRKVGQGQPRGRPAQNRFLYC